MNCNGLLDCVQVYQLINLLQKIPFLGAADYIAFRKTHVYRFNDVVLKHSSITQPLILMMLLCKGLVRIISTQKGLSKFGTIYADQVLQLEKGKPCESRGRKVTGLKEPLPMIAGLQVRHNYALKSRRSCDDYLTK